MQRKRGQVARIYTVTKHTDARGNVVEVPTTEFLEVRGAFTPDRSARAELPGQQQVNVVRMITNSDLSGVNLWSRVSWSGIWWDVVAPPSWHFGARQTKHWSLILRQRPDSGGNLQ